MINLIARATKLKIAALAAPFFVLVVWTYAFLIEPF